MKFILKIIIGTLITVGSSHANEIKIFDFTEKELSQLNVRKVRGADNNTVYTVGSCLLYTSPSPRDRTRSRMPSSA